MPGGTYDFHVSIIEEIENEFHGYPVRVPIAQEPHRAGDIWRKQRHYAVNQVYPKRLAARQGEHALSVWQAGLFGWQKG